MSGSKKNIPLMSAYGFRAAFADEKDTSFLRKAIQLCIQSPSEISEIEILSKRCTKVLF